MEQQQKKMFKMDLNKLQM